jgi:acyl-CoA synthetase (AMP-forming)/AMP-acid ligase II
LNAPTPPTLQAALLQQLDASPESPSLAFVDARGEFSWQTRAEVYQAASRHARALAALGCNPGDACVLVLPSDPLCASLLLGVLLRGAHPLLVAPPIIQKSEHSSLVTILQHVLGRVRPAVVLAPPTLRGMEADLAEACPEARMAFVDSDLEDEVAGADAANRPGETDIAAMQLTSGTTGLPRICVWRQRNVMAALEGMRQAMRLGSEDVCFNWTPLYHDMGLVNNFFLSLTLGVPLALLPPTEFLRRPALWLRGLSDTGATTTWSPNFGFALAAQRLEDRELEGVSLENVRAFWNAAERVHLDTMQAFQKRFRGFGLRRGALKTNFGCAENIGGATFSQFDGDFRWEKVDSPALHERGVAQPPAGDGPSQTIVGVGRAHPDLTIHIRTPEGVELGDGEVGEVVLETPSRLEGYLGDTDATARALTADGVRTGDLGYLRDGELFWVGRVRERMNVRGRKIDPSEFERSLLQVQGLRQGCFAVFGVEDAEQGTQKPVLISELREPCERPHEELLAEMRQRIIDDLGIVLDDILLVGRGTLAKTSSGKRRHRHFRDLYLRRELEYLASSKDFGKG